MELSGTIDTLAETVASLRPGCGETAARLEEWGFAVRDDPVLRDMASAEDCLLSFPFSDRKAFEARLRGAGWGSLLPDAPPPSDSRALVARIAFTLCRTLRFLSLGRRESPNYLQKADAVFREGKPLFQQLPASAPGADAIRRDVAYVAEGCRRALHPSLTDTDF